MCHGQLFFSKWLPTWPLFRCEFFVYPTAIYKMLAVSNVSWSTFFFKMASNMAAIYKMAAQKAVFNGFRRGFLRTVPARSQMCHGQHFFSKWLPTWPSFTKWPLKKQFLTNFDAVFCVQYQLGLKCVMVNIYFQNGFQHGRHLQNGRSKSSF